jgi:hypothetical protein
MGIGEAWATERPTSLSTVHASARDPKRGPGLVQRFRSSFQGLS